MRPLQRYQLDLQERGLQPDAWQARAVECLDDLYAELTSREGSKSGLLPRLFSRRATPVKGLYLWGGTGRGKTYLMDTFYACLEMPHKHRLHYHRFMCDVHRQLNELSHSPDPLAIIAKQWSARYRLLCLDEFHVLDITDAMILARLLQALFENGVTLVTTSNIVIDELYKNGLQRSSFLPAIALLHEYTREVDIGDGTDYRMSLLDVTSSYRVASKGKGQQALQNQFEMLSSVPPKTNRRISINQREIDYVGWANELIWFDFNQLCNSHRSVNDYMEIARSFQTVFVSDVYQMGDERDDVAKRFVHLIDVLYDHHVKLFISAEVAAEELYTGKRMAFSFERAISRLSEMATKQYLKMPHVGIV